MNTGLTDLKSRFFALLRPVKCLIYVHKGSRFKQKLTWNSSVWWLSLQKSNKPQVQLNAGLVANVLKSGETSRAAQLLQLETLPCDVGKSFKKGFVVVPSVSAWQWRLERTLLADRWFYIISNCVSLGFRLLSCATSLCFNCRWVSLSALTWCLWVFSLLLHLEHV